MTLPTQPMPEIIEPDYGPLLAIVEVTRLALEHEAVDIARSWSAIAERLMQPLVLMSPTEPIYENASSS